MASSITSGDSVFRRGAAAPLANVSMVSHEPLPLLEAGDNLDQPTFHRRYEAMSNVRAELVQGIVYMPAAAAPRHGRVHGLVATWVCLYESETAGMESYVDTTAILGPNSEPQPDAFLIIPPEKGGQMKWSREFPEYLEGAPEFVAEVANSSEAYDLHQKRADYERQGVREYLVVALRQKRVYWFASREGAFRELAPDEDGLLKSTAFPGLWLDPDAIVKGNVKRVIDVLHLGLATPAHAAFAEELSRR
jgi:Uma2 family endonuclease